MSDRITKQQRSYNMSQIKGKDTKIEVSVRSFLFKKGYRYRKNVKTLPGTPDIVLNSKKTVIFVNGCFWHHHNDCKLAYMPKTNIDYWQDKFNKNIANDEKNIKQIKKMGYKVIILWECKLKRDFCKEMEKTYKTIEKRSRYDQLDVFPSKQKNRRAFTRGD